MKQQDIKKALSDNNDTCNKNNILKNVRKGSLLIFKSGISNAKVFDVTNTASDSAGNISQARIWARHDDGHESYHTYRYDGMSHHSEINDIIEIQNQAT